MRTRAVNVSAGPRGSNSARMRFSTGCTTTRSCPSRAIAACTSGSATILFDMSSVIRTRSVESSAVLCPAFTADAQPGPHAAINSSAYPTNRFRTDLRITAPSIAADADLVIAGPDDQPPVHVHQVELDVVIGRSAARQIHRRGAQRVVRVDRV